MIVVLVAAIVLGLALAYLWKQKQLEQANGSAARVGNPASLKKPRLSESIADKYKSFPEVRKALQKSGLESSNLIIGIDFTKSNNWTGENTFGGKNLHFLPHIDVCIRASVSEFPWIAWKATLSG